MDREDVLGRIRSLVPEQAGGGFEWNGYVLLFTAGISIAAGNAVWICAGPASDERAAAGIPKEGGRSGESQGGLRLRDTLVVGQFALAFALLVCAGLMIETLWNLRNKNSDFRPIIC